MSKFSKEFKFRVVQEYLNSSVGIGQLARKYGIKSDASILKWVNQYQVFGEEGLEVRRPTFIYDGSFKVNVLKCLKTNNASLSETALHFNISEPSTIWAWKRKLEADGIDALYSVRGRPKIMSADKQGKNKKKQTELERLREENELLQIENDYLKKLRALVQSQRDKERKSSKN